MYSFVCRYLKNAKPLFIFCLFSFILFSPPLFSQVKEDALVLYRQGQYKRAAAVCRAEIEQTPRNLDSYVVLIWALIADKKYRESLEWINKGRAISYHDPRLIESHGIALYELGQNKKSLSLFEEYVTYAPNGTKLGEVYHYIGEIYLRMAQYHHADIAFSAAVQLQTRNSTWWTRLGYAREQAREYRHALEAYSSALKLNKNTTDAQKGYDRVLKHF